MTTTSGKAKAEEVIRFALDNNFVIHPKIGYKYFVDNWMKYKNCPCAPERKQCPCPESIEEIHSGGRCKCGLFWQSLDTYIESGTL